jgi:hypothetical protein
MLKYNEDNIKELLLRFTEGQTTEAEEKVLKDYFTQRAYSRRMGSLQGTVQQF